MEYNQPRNYRKDVFPNQDFPREDDHYLYFYFCKNDTDEYMDLQQRILPYAEITPVKNFYPYDSTINVQIKIKKESVAAEWICYMLPYLTKAMASIMGFQIQAFVCYLINYSSPWYANICNPTLKVALEDSVKELLDYFGKTKIELYEAMLEFYGSDFIWQNFMYTHQQIEKYKSIWNRPDMLHKEPNPNYDSWYNVSWKSEMRLFDLVRAYYPDAQLHFTSRWLGNQHLDIYSPSGNIAFEFQGKQHFESIDYFGGEDEFFKRRQLDEKKRESCLENRVILITWEYTLPILPIYFIRKLRENSGDWERKPSVYRKTTWENMNAIMAKPPARGANKKKTVILRVSMKGEVEKEYGSVEEAAEDTKISKKGIDKVIYGERKSCGGYIWVKCVKEAEDL